MYDVVIIGAGIIGTTILRALTRYQLKVLIVDKENDFSAGTTKANSAIIHAGYDASYDSKKGIFNARGNQMFDDLCKELHVHFERIGSLVVAHTDSDMKKLEALKENGEKLKIPGLKIISQKEVRALEPNLNKDIIAALYAPTAGIIEPWELAIACAENAIDNGAEAKLNFEVTNIEKTKKGFIIYNQEQRIECKTIINAAGVYADKINHMVTKEVFSIIPRRGQYFLLDKTAKGLVNHIVFQCPTDMGKGTLLTPTTEGNIIIGPDSENLLMDQKENTNTTYERLNHVKAMAKEIIHDIPYRENITTFAGLRAESSTGDFIIEASPSTKGFINVAGIKSPGLSSAPAIAEYVVELVDSTLGGLEKNHNFNPIRRPRQRFEFLSPEERSKKIQENPAWGRIICRCEMITEGEIIDAIHRSAGGRTLNGIKRRARPGAGRCQGGFCGPRVMEILARELKCDITDILQENKGSKILVGETKNV